MSRALANHNPLNIRKGNKWYGESPNSTDTEFETFLNDAYGFRAAFRIIHNGFKASPPRNTVRSIITRWAPPEDGNHTKSYIDIVCQRAGLNPDERLAYQDITRMCALVHAMAYVESGHEYNMRVVTTAYNMER